MSLDRDGDTRQVGGASRPDGPLAGVRVVDLTSNMSGPYATQMLGDQGADVVKVESPAGDTIRTIGTSRRGMSAFFANLNRSKRSIAIDLTRPEARRVMDALLDRADVVVANFRPGVSAALGLDAETVTANRPSLVYAEIVGFGDHGPYAGRPAYDQVIQALAGYAAIQADLKSRRPTLVQQGVIDKATAQATAQAVTAALVGRGRTGAGRVLRIRMLDVALAFMWPDGMMTETILEPDLSLPSIVNTFRLTDTADGQIAFIAVTTDQWAGLLRAVEIPYDDRLATPAGRVRHGGEYMRRAVRTLGSLTTHDAVERLSANGVPAAPVLSLDDIPSHPQVVANGTVGEVEHPLLGRIRQANPAIRFGDDDIASLRPAPRLGEHTDEVLRELGFSDVEVGRLRASSVLAGP